MADLNIGRYANLLRSLLLIRGSQGSPLPEVSPELVPTLPLEVDRPEWAWLGGTDLYGGGYSRTPAAGQKATARLVNPVGSGKLVVVEQFRIRLSVTGPASLGVTDNLSGVVTSTARGSGRDSRVGTDNSSAIIEVGDNLPLTGFIGFIDVVANESQVVELPIVLTPGFALVIASNPSDAQLVGSLFWYERPLEQTEDGP